ncbi:TonB family protein [Longibacter sp.]|jgi:protein TonB|uniref:energy transducer TonB n=1 Tax=Longibacter sp. TaxID=2045415 RepID=UPI003EC02683
MAVSKSSGSTWRRDYSLHLATGAVISLTVILAAASVSLYRSTPDTPVPPPPEVVDLQDLPPPTAEAAPPAPNSPLPPVVVPNETIIAADRPISFEPTLPIDAGTTATGSALPDVGSKPAHDEPFVVVEQMPKPRGGMAALYENVEYPERAKRVGVEGQVAVRFTVRPDGSVTDIIVEKSANDLLNDAAVKALRATEFIPGRQRSRTVPVRMTIPITFRLR